MKRVIGLCTWRRTWRCAWKIAFAAVLTGCGAEHSRKVTGAPQSRSDVSVAVDLMAEEALREGPIAGLSIAVIERGRPLVMKGYGFADLENDVRATPDTLYRIGSLTKQFTAAAILQLVERGRIRLSDVIASYIPQLPTHLEPITVEQLLHQTSGIRDFTELGPRFDAVVTRDLTPAQVLALVADLPLEFLPGAKWKYSNTNYHVLGMIVERVTGQRYAEYVVNSILKPAGLMSTVYCSERPVLKRRAQGYEVRDHGFVNDEILSMEIPFAGGGLCSTVGDLARWQDALEAGTVLGTESLGHMRRPGVLADGTPTFYGDALFLQRVGGHRLVWHDGGINGFSSVLVREPDARTTIVLLANTHSSILSGLRRRVTRTVLGIESTPPGDLAISDEELGRCPGEYQLPDGEKLVIVRRDRALFIRANASERRMQRQRDASYIVPMSERSYMFEPAQGPVKSVRVFLDPDDVVAQRVATTK